MKKLLCSEWIKFRSGYMSVGLAIIFVVLLPFLMLSLDDVKNVGLEKRVMSELLHALYLAQIAIIIFASFHFGQEFVKSSFRTNCLAVPKRKKWLLAKFIFFFLLLFFLYFLALLLCLLLIIFYFKLNLTMPLLLNVGRQVIPALISNFVFAFLAAGLTLIFQSWRVATAILFPLLLGLSHLLLTFFREAKYLPDLATLSLFDYKEVAEKIELSGLGIQVLWLCLIVGSAIFLTLKRDVR